MLRLKINLKYWLAALLKREVGRKNIWFWSQSLQFWLDSSPCDDWKFETDLRSHWNLVPPGHSNWPRAYGHWAQVLQWSQHLHLCERKLVPSVLQFPQKSQKGHMCSLKPSPLSRSKHENITMMSAVFLWTSKQTKPKLSRTSFQIPTFFWTENQRIGGLIQVHWHQRRKTYPFRPWYIERCTRRGTVCPVCHWGDNIFRRPW